MPTAETLITKYRPQVWEDVIGQDSIVKSFRTALEKNKSHAFLLIGPSGVGKTTLAGIASGSVGCFRPTLINAAKYRGIDDWRAITDTLQYRPMDVNPYKVIIIDEDTGINLQKNDNQPEQLKLIYPIDIRWTSLINGIERLHALKKYVEQVNKCISKNYWEQLNYLYEILIPFKKAINNIQRNDSTIYSVWNNFNDIVNYYNSSNVPKIFQNDIKNITNVIINKWNQHVNKELIEISRIFNLELHVKYSNKTIDFIKDWGSDYLIFYNLINNVNKKDLMETINIQLNEFNLRYGDFSTINEQNEKLKCTYAIRQKRYDIKLLWNLCIISYYELSNIAIAILSICPSEAQVERSFSIQADVHSLDRNKLHAELVEAEMNIKMNIPD